MPVNAAYFFTFFFTFMTVTFIENFVPLHKDTKIFCKYFQKGQNIFFPSEITGLFHFFEALKLHFDNSFSNPFLINLT